MVVGDCRGEPGVAAVPSRKLLARDLERVAVGTGRGSFRGGAAAVDGSGFGGDALADSCNPADWRMESGRTSVAGIDPRPAKLGNGTAHPVAGRSAGPGGRRSCLWCFVSGEFLGSHALSGARAAGVALGALQYPVGCPWSLGCRVAIGGAGKCGPALGEPTAVDLAEPRRRGRAFLVASEPWMAWAAL